MKKALVIIGASCSLCIATVIPAYARASSASPAPLMTRNNPTTSTAKLALQQFLEQAQNGRDLAFADARATLMQSLSTAGKDGNARKAATAIYKAATAGIISAYKAAITGARAAYKAALASIKGK